MTKLVRPRPTISGRESEDSADAVEEDDPVMGCMLFVWGGVMRCEAIRFDVVPYSSGMK